MNSICFCSFFFFQITIFHCQRRTIYCQYVLLSQYVWLPILKFTIVIRAACFFGRRKLGLFAVPTQGNDQRERVLGQIFWLFLVKITQNSAIGLAFFKSRAN